MQIKAKKNKLTKTCIARYVYGTYEYSNSNRNYYTTFIIVPIYAGSLAYDLVFRSQHSVPSQLQRGVYD